MEAYNFNIVVLAQFNPSEFSELFYVKNNLISEGDIDKTRSYFTFENSRCVTKDFVIDVVMNRISFAILDVKKTNLYNDLFIKLLYIKKDLTYTGLGINYSYGLDVKDEELIVKSKEFFKGTNNIYSSFSEDNCAYGVYLSKDFKGVRLKLEAKPIISTKISNIEDKISSINFNFNFHKDLDNIGSIEQLKTIIERNSEYEDEANKIFRLSIGLCD